MILAGALILLNSAAAAIKDTKPMGSPSSSPSTQTVDRAPKIPVTSSPSAPVPPMPSPTPSESPTTTSESATGIPDDMLKIRDPFKRPEVAQIITARTPLEKFPVESFKLVGVLTGPDRLRAMVQDPTGKVHFVWENVAIGTRGGRIVKISPDLVRVREKVANLLGQVENEDRDILYTTEDKKKEDEELKSGPK